MSAPIASECKKQRGFSCLTFQIFILNRGDLLVSSLLWWMISVVYTSYRVLYSGMVGRVM